MYLFQATSYFATGVAKLEKKYPTRQPTNPPQTKKQLENMGN